MAAFECAETAVRVIQVTKGRATSGTTTVARGGFAAAMGKDDSSELHLQDILKHGGELIDPELARVWVHDIIDVVRDLESWGAEFVRGTRRPTRSQSVSQSFQKPGLSSLRHHRQHDNKGAIEEVAR